MTRYGASARDYSRKDDFDTYHPRRTVGTNDRAYTRGDSRATFHGGRGGTADRFTTSGDDDDESEYETRGSGYRQHHRAGAGGVRNTGTTIRRRRDRTPTSLDSDIERLRREVREDEARRSGSRFGGGYCDDDGDDDDDSDGSRFAHRTVTVAPRGGATRTGGVCTGTGNGSGNGGTHRRRRPEDPIIEQLRREVREDETRLSGSRGGRYSDDDDSEGETAFGRCLEREGRGGGRGNGVRSGHFDESEDEGMERGRRGVSVGVVLRGCSLINQAAEVEGGGWMDGWIVEDAS